MTLFGVKKYTELHLTHPSTDDLIRRAVKDAEEVLTAWIVVGPFDGRREI
jgi:hypothetical protein